MRVGVVGLGGVGTAAARFLAGAGHQVVGFEQFGLDHDRGSSYGGSRIIRRVYPDPLYAGLMNAAYPLWEELERRAGESLLLKCGGFFFGPDGSRDMAETEGALTSVGVPFERWSASAAAEKLPQFRLRPDEYGIFEPESGLLRASRCVVANARGARAAGADLRESIPVEAIEPASGGIEIRSPAGTERFDRLVLAAGPWTGRLVSRWLPLPLTVTRQQYAHFRPLAEPELFRPGRFPVWIDMGELAYGFPEHDDFPGVKVAFHIAGVPWDPDSADRQPNEQENEALRAYLARRLPLAAGPVSHTKVCLYTMTPDEDFLVDRLPDDPRIVFVGGLSGHGFKFTVLLGQIAARMATDQDAGYPIDRFSFRRFSESCV